MVEIMSSEDAEEFARSTTLAERSLSTSAPRAFLAVLGLMLVAGGALAVLIRGEGPDSLVLVLVLVLVLALSAAAAVPGLWSLRHEERARQVVVMRARAQDRELREHPARWFALLVPAGAVVSLVRLTHRSDPVIVQVLAAVGGAAVMAAVLGVQVWRSRRRSSHA